MPRAATPISLAELGRWLGCERVSGGDFIVEGVAALGDAGPGDLSFLRSHRHASAADVSAAGALIAPEDFDSGGRPTLYSPRPDLDFARAVEHLVVAPRPPAGRDRSAVVAADAHVADSAAIGPACVVGAGSRVGERSVLHANVTLYPGVEIGDDCELHAGVVVREGTRIGRRVLLQPGVVIGGDGFGYVPDRSGAPRRMPQVGTVVIEDDVEIGSGTTVDRATLGETRIRCGAKIDNLVMVAHNCDVGEQSIVVAQTGFSGSTVVGRRAIVMAQVGTAGHLRIGDGAFVSGRSGLRHDVPDAARVAGWPAAPERDWHRQMAALTRLPDMLRRLRAVERALEAGADEPPVEGRQGRQGRQGEDE